MSDKENERKFIRDYKIVKEIGQGGFGTVYLCEDITGAGKKVAIKEIPKANKSKIDPQTEVEIHRKLTEKNRHRFVKIIEDFAENENVYLVMEYCAEGSLKDYVKEHGPMGVLLATDVIRQLCDALKLMHEENIAHRDLTPGNVLIREINRGRNGGEVKRISVKVTDFGLSKETPKNAHGHFKTTLGTAPFMAPEVKEGKYYTKALDMFSLGSVFYTLLTKDYLPPKQKQFNLTTILGKVMGMHSVQALDEEVRNNLKLLLSGMLCSERGRIKLEEIDIHPFMGWFYEERGQDPEWPEFCSHSRSTNDTKRRNSRSRSRDFLMRQPQLQLALPIRKPNNRDSALGSSDHAQQYQQPSQSHSGRSQSRCYHPVFDPECRVCPYNPATSSAAAFAGLKSSAVGIRQMAFDGHSEPIARMNQPKFLTDSNPIGHQKLRNTALMVSQPKTAPIMPARNSWQPPQQQPQQNNTNREALYNLEQPPWPFPRIRHDYTHVNERGRCIFYKYSSSSRSQFHLVAFMEKTASTQDQTIAGIFEVWQNGHGEQELLVFEPKSRNAQRPERAAPRTTTTGQAISTIRSYDELIANKNKAAKKGYVTLWGFLKVMASKAIKASCQEKRNEKKYRVDLCLNGWARLYLGPENRPEAELEHWGVQKAEDAEFEMKRGDVSRQEVHLAEELAQTLRLEVRQSALMAPNFDGRNIRCTVYT